MGILIYSMVFTKDRQPQLSDQLIAMKGLDGTNLMTISLGEITAVVSEIEKTELVANQANAIRFAEIIDHLDQQFTLLPMRFGSIVDTLDSVSHMLKINYQGFIKNLVEVENKLEFGLKIYCDPEKLKEELRLESELQSNELNNTYSNHSVSVYRDYVNKKLKAHRLEQKLLSYIDAVTAEFSEIVAQWNAESKIKKKVTASKVVDAVFLIDQARKVELIQSIEGLQAKYPRLSFVLTGPWPPYNFVDVTPK
ncbi:MAG: hypothetical protein COW44_15300 [Flavobacteriaceae bacterium CG17_big_fil_post_rev_8_21_14_2_50_33_15]|nr:MAG: hypothetical protein COW44_15300 [Flavobacteriaceae bacterium CG17_big_fil_post_rev_8_21_14_2_50_33_15]